MNDQHDYRPAILERLKTFALENGRRWKSKLRSLWNSGKDDGLLRLARNTIGPGAELDKLKFVQPWTAEERKCPTKKPSSDL